MGLPARKLGATARGAGRERTSRLRLVSPPQCARRTASDAAEAACLSVFRLAVMALVAFTARDLAVSLTHLVPTLRCTVIFTVAAPAGLRRPLAVRLLWSLMAPDLRPASVSVTDLFTNVAAIV